MKTNRGWNCVTGFVLAVLFAVTAASAANNPNVYLAMGDGITKGSPPTIGDPWPPRLDRLLGSGKTVINEAKSGSRVGYGSYKVSSYLSKYQPGYLLILYGTNDIGIGNDINYIIGELRDMIRAAKGRYTVPIIGTLPPVFNGLGGGLNTLNSRIRDLARSEGIVCADVSRAFNNKRSLIMSDGLHPTPEGQQLIAKTFYNAIKAAPPPPPPPPPVPTLSISPTSASYAKEGGAGSIKVTVSGGSLAWNASTASSWIRITGGASGTGSGNVGYTVDPNTNKNARSGAIAVSGKSCAITQNGTYENLALARRGATINGSNGGRWDQLIDGVTSGYTKTGIGYGYTIWTNDPAAPGRFELDLGKLARVDRTRVLLWDLDARYYQYFMEASADGVTWTTIVNRTTGQWKGWQDVRLPAEIEARYFRLTGTFNSMNSGFHVVEWEVYGYPAPVAPAPVSLLVRKTARSAAPAGARPAGVVVSSGEAPKTNGWNAVDGNLETAWSGRAGDNGWWLALAYDPPLQVSDVEIWLDASSTTNVMMLGSEDALDWFEVPAALEEGPVWLRYLWLVFEKDEAGRSPVVLEVRPIP